MKVEEKVLVNYPSKISEKKMKNQEKIMPEMEILGRKLMNKLQDKFGNVRKFTSSENFYRIFSEPVDGYEIEVKESQITEGYVRIKNLETGNIISVQGGYFINDEKVIGEWSDWDNKKYDYEVEGTRYSTKVIGDFDAVELLRSSVKELFGLKFSPRINGSSKCWYNIEFDVVEDGVYPTLNELSIRKMMINKVNEFAVVCDVMELFKHFKSEPIFSTLLSKRDPIKQEGRGNKMKKNIQINPLKTA